MVALQETCDRLVIHYSPWINLEEKQQKNGKNIGQQRYLVYPEEGGESNEDTAAGFCSITHTK